MTVKRKKSKTSQIKKSNINKTKLYRQGKIKKKKRKITLSQPNCSRKPNDEESSKDVTFDSENLLQMIDKQDLDFLRKAVSNPSYSLYNKKSNYKEKEKKRKNIDDEIDIIEEKYEREIELESQKPKKTRYLLPVKTAKGLEQRTVEEDYSEEEEKESNDDKTEETPEKCEGSDRDIDLPEVEEDEHVEGPLSTAELLARREKLVTQYKLRIGVLASSLLEDPQTRNYWYLHPVQKIMSKAPASLVFVDLKIVSAVLYICGMCLYVLLCIMLVDLSFEIKNIALLMDTMYQCKYEVRFTVHKLVILSLTEVFKDILPSYQIKHQETTVKLKKDTKQLQDFEKSLLKGYRLFLMRLEKLAKKLVKKKGDNRVLSEPMVRLAELSIGCVVDLLERHPYFNYSRNIVQMLTPYLDHPRESVRQRVANGYTRVFKDDKRGEITLEIVRRINHLVKSRSHSVHKEVISVLLALRIKDVNLDREKEDEIKQKKFMTHKQKLLAMSKRERKRSKKLEELEKELLETKAEENKESKQKNLTEVMKVVFTIYFRILKKAPSSKVLSSALEGLAKFAHCINIEFFADLVSVLDDLMENSSLKNRERLHCVQTVFSILSGQGEVLNIDPSRFYTHLYNNLLYIYAGRTHEDMKIVLRIMEVVLIQRRKKITHQRLLAFTKRICMLATQLLHNGAVGTLSLIRRVMQVGMGVDVLLDVDSTLGQGIYNPELEDPEHSNAASSALWELTSFQRHYHPTVRLMAKHIVTREDHHDMQLPADIAKLDSVQLFDHFDPSQVAFRPAVPAPAKEISGIVKSKENSDYIQQLLKHVGSLPQDECLSSLHEEVFRNKVKKGLPATKHLQRKK